MQTGKRIRGSFGAAATFLATLAFGAPAHAEPISELIPRLVEQGGWLHAHYPGQGGAQPERATLFSRAPVVAPTDLLGTHLAGAVVARDWYEAYNLTDGRSLLFDRFRMIRSNRMAVTRVSFAGGRLLPYAEVSFGQWRPDSDLVPWLRSDLETAGQIVVGFEMHVAPRCVFAWDAEQTKIYASAANVPATRLYASFAALRAEF
jgi:hypothetical protein